MDHDGIVGIADVMYLIDLIFDEYSAEDHTVADVDNDNEISIADVVFLIDMIFTQDT